jgi:hypothetical protein
MPLKSGKSQKTKSKNIAELMRKYKKTGKIGTSKPKSKKAAKKQAAAIAYNKARGGKKRLKKESFDQMINTYLNQYIFEDAMASSSSLKPANPADPATRQVMDAKKKKASQTPTQAEVDAFKQGNIAAQQGTKIRP